MFCRRCGSQIPEGLGMCSVCGLEISAAWPASAAYPAAAPTQSTIVPPPPTQAAPVLAGVGGWLLFFCICLTIFWPLWMLYSYARFHFAFRGLAWLGVLRLGLGFVTGVVLWTKKPAAMVLLRIYFGLGALLTLWALVNWALVLTRVSMQPSLIRSFLSGFVLPLCFLVAGVLYFSQSERVRATYGSKLL